LGAEQGQSDFDLSGSVDLNAFAFPFSGASLSRRMVIDPYRRDYDVAELVLSIGENMILARGPMIDH